MDLKAAGKLRAQTLADGFYEFLIAVWSLLATGT
jgi:hypothetical protein